MVYNQYVTGYRNEMLCGLTNIRILTNVFKKLVIVYFVLVTLVRQLIKATRYSIYLSILSDPTIRDNTF